MNLRSGAFVLAILTAVGCSSQVEPPPAPPAVDAPEGASRESEAPEADLDDGVEPQNVGTYQCVSWCQSDREFCMGVAWDASEECLCGNAYCRCLARCRLRGCVAKKCPPPTP